MMITFSQFRQYFWYIFGIMGVVFFWVGIWDGLGSLPYLQHPLISLAIGIVMLTASGFIFRGVSPLWGKGNKAEAVLHRVHSHPLRHEFHIKYYDKLNKKHLLLQAEHIKKIEKGFLILLEKGKERFVPTHRVTEILRKGKTHWKV